MRVGKRAAGMAAAAALMATVGLGASSGTAHADGLFLLKGWGTGQCLSTNHTTHVVTVNDCSRSDRWFPALTSHKASDGHFEEIWMNFPSTTMCLQSTGVTKGSPLRLAPCNPDDLFQVWDDTKRNDGYDQFKLGVPGFNVCLDRPTETELDGEHMQVWTCADSETPFPWEDQHMEQRFTITQ